MSDAPFRWIDSTSWELPFFGLPSRIPWPSAVAEEVAQRNPFELEHLLDAIDTMGAHPGEPWAAFREAAKVLDDLADALEDMEVGPASELIGKFEAAFPGTAFVLYHRGMVARLEGREDDALAAFKEAAAKTDKVPALWNNVGLLLAMRGERDEAIAAFKKVLDLHAGDATALEGLAQLRAIVKVVRDPQKPQEVSYIDIPTYGNMMVQQLNSVADQPDQILALGEQLLRDGLLPELGFKAVMRAAELRPDDPRTLMAVANGWRIGGNKEKTRETLVRFTEVLPNEPRGFFSLAQAYAEEDNRPGERQALEKVIELDPNAQAAIAIYFGLAPGEHDPKKEEALTNFATERKSWMAFILASDLARRRGDAQTGMKWAERAYEVNPDSEEVLLQYTGAIGETRDFTKLASVIKPRVEEGRFSKRLDWAYAQTLHQLGLVPDATAALRRAASGPDVPEDFKQQAATTLDAWSGRVTGCGVPLEIHQTGYLIRPLLVTLEDGDGGVVVQAGAPLPATGNFVWRANGAETRVALQQGQSGTLEPRALGTFVVGEIQRQPDRTTIDCHVIIQRDGAIHFRATQDGRKLRVGWTPPSTRG